MRFRAIQSQEVLKAGRLDCKYFVAPHDIAAGAVEAAKAVGGGSICLAEAAGTGGIWAPGRFKRAYAAIGEQSVPYLRPYDVFNYFPEAADWLSSLRTERLSDYQLRRGTILQTCSGRNLGPAVIVDRYLERFVLSHDMIRIEVADELIRHYLLAFLNSRAGRALVRRDKTGSVIDHISVAHLAKLEIPRLESVHLSKVARAVGEAVRLRERARLALDRALVSYEAALPPLTRAAPLSVGWTIGSDQIAARVDAASYDPLVSTVRSELTKLGGCRVTDVAVVLKPGGRYKTRYVESTYGRPLLSGAQVLQTAPIDLKFMGSDVFKEVADYELHAGWIAYPADGRAEEELGTPVMITADREGWLASGHVGRVVPKTGVDAGWLFLALMTRHARIQLKARASGSVVDSTFREDMEEVILPPPLETDGEGVRQLWDDFRESQALEEGASAAIDELLAQYVAVQLQPPAGGA